MLQNRCSRECNPRFCKCPKPAPCTLPPTKIGDASPQSRAHLQTLVGAVEEKRPLALAVVECDSERARSCHYKLAQCAVGMCTPFLAARHIVKVVNPFHVKRQRVAILHHGKVAFAVRVVSVQFDNRAVEYTIFLHVASFVCKCRNPPHSRHGCKALRLFRAPTSWWRSL